MMGPWCCVLEQPDGQQLERHVLGLGVVYAIGGVAWFFIDPVTPLDQHDVIAVTMARHTR